MTDLTTIRENVNRELTNLQVARTAVRQEKATAAELEQRLSDLRVALGIAQTVAQRLQEEAHKKIADIVTRSLQLVFDEPYTFHIRFEQKRGRTEASLVFERDGLEVDPMTASGGGAVDVAAFALRLSCLLLSMPPRRRVLIMDEPFRFLSVAYRPRVRELLHTLASELNCQFIFVTHQDELRTGKVIEI